MLDSLLGAAVNGLGVTVLVYLLLYTASRIGPRSLDRLALSMGALAALGILISDLA